MSDNLSPLLAKLMGLFLLGLIRTLTGAQARWQGCPPKAEQRIYFANHQSHADLVLMWAALPEELRSITRPIAAKDYWTKTPFKKWITTAVFNAIYVDRAKTGDQDPLEPLIEALTNGDSIILFPEGTRGNQEEPQKFKAGLYNLALKFPAGGAGAGLDQQRAARHAQGRSRAGAHPVLGHFRRADCAGRRRRPRRIPDARAPGGDGFAGILMNTFLRNLSPSHQVGLLFVLVFGILTVISVAAFVMSLKDTHEDDLHTQKLKEFNGLLRTSWLMSTVFWIGWTLGETVATVLFGMVAFFALREFITLSPTRQGDHRSLVLAFFVVLPVQFALVITRRFDLVTVFIPVYVFLAIPVVSALADDPHRFLERNAKLQWGIMVCVYGISHVPALLLLKFPNYDGKNAFLVFFLVFVVQSCMIVEHLVGRKLQRPPSAPNVSKSFNWTSWLIAVALASLLGGLLAGLTPFKPAQAVAMAFIACVSGSLGHLVMKALKRDRGIPNWGKRGVGVTGASGLLDRVDALCFGAPIFFHSVRWYFGL
jgi:phosphatidate cytidylyltransferase